MTHVVAGGACERFGPAPSSKGASRPWAARRSSRSRNRLHNGDDDARGGRGRAQGGRPRAIGMIARDVRRSLGESAHRSRAQHADRGGDDAVARSAEGVHRGRRAARGRKRGRVDSFFERAIAIDPSSPWPTPRCRASTAASARRDAAKILARLAYEHRARVSERERLFITYQYHDRVTGDQLKTREALGSLEADLPEGLPAVERARAAPHPPGEYAGRSPRRRTRSSGIPPTRFRGRTSRMRCAARAATPRRNGPPSALSPLVSKRCRRAACSSARGDGRRSTRKSAAPSGLGPKPSARVRFRRRASAGHGLPWTDERGTKGVSADHGGGEPKSARADRERLSPGELRH